MTEKNLQIITEIDNEPVELTDEETEFLLNYRMSDEKTKLFIETLLEDMKSEE